ncbi:MAG: MFS transporter [Pseudomonadales bacterium]|nr:MFS transporter [Pseudomonadales bacterium]
MSDQHRASSDLQPGTGKEAVSGQQEGAYPAAGKAWWIVFVLLSCYTLSFIDRQIVALMVGPIRADLDISDFQFSLLTGFAFALLYSFLGVPIGIMADSSNRKRIIAWGIAIWSIMTALCGTARSYTMLFIFRIGVGVGEAALSPCAYSIVADSFTKEQRAKPMGAYSMGTYVGAGLAMIFGGMVAQYIVGLGPITWPILGEMRPWQIVFFVVSLPAIPVLLLLATFREPRRQDLGAGETMHRVDFKATLHYMAQRWQLYCLIIFGIGILALISFAVFAWYIEFFIRLHHWSRQQAGLAFGLVVLFCGSGGMFAAGMISDHLLARGYKDAPIRTARYSAMILLLPLSVAPLLSNPWLALALLMPGVFALGFHVGLGPSALQHITPNKMRGQVIALYLLALNLMAQMVGPSAVAWFTTYVFRDDLALGKSLSIVSGFAAVLALWVLSLAAKKMAVYENE